MLLKAKCPFAFVYYTTAQPKAATNHLSTGCINHLHSMLKSKNFIFCVYNLLLFLYFIHLRKCYWRKIAFYLSFIFYLPTKFHVLQKYPGSGSSLQSLYIIVRCPFVLIPPIPLLPDWVSLIACSGITYFVLLVNATLSHTIAGSRQ